MKPKYYNPDPQSWDDDLPEVDGDDLDAELDNDQRIDYDEMIEREGVNADNNGWY